MLDELLQPIIPALFWSEYWEKRPLHIARPSPVWYRELASIDDLEAIISLTSAPRQVADDLRLVRSTSDGLKDDPMERGADGRPDMAAVYRAYGKGSTIVVDRLDLRWAPVARLAARIADETGYLAGVNLYCSPPGAQGFPAHADAQDVFLLQIEGSKSWRIDSPEYELPLEGKLVPLKAEEGREPLLQTTIEPGHLLYIPRGFIHAGVANREASMHLTLSIYATRWVELLGAALTVAAEQDVRFRRTVPALDLKDEELIDAVRNELALLFQGACGRDVAAKAIGRVLNTQLRTQPNSPDPHFKTVDRARSLSGKTEVARRFGFRPRVIREEHRVRIQFGTRSVSAPQSAASALDYVSSQEKFRVDDLPGPLDEASKIVLVRRLIHEGLLTISVTHTE